MNELLKLLFVGVSLHSYYFYSIGLALISMTSLFLLTIIIGFNSFSNGVRLQNRTSVGVALGYSLLLSWSLIGLLFYSENPDEKRLLAFLVMIFASLVAGALFRTLQLKEVIRHYLLVHVFFFYLQFITFYTTGYTIDYIEPITGEVQRMFGGSFSLPVIDQFMRPAGLFNEPGTYATFVAPFVALWGRWNGESAANERLFWISLSTLFLSLSVFGILFCALILLLSRNIRIGCRVSFLVISIAFVLPFLHYRFVVRPSLGLGTGLEYRTIFVEESLEFLFSNTIAFVFGSNLLVLDPRAEFVAAFNDAGMILYLAHFSGPPLTLFFGAVLFYFATRVDRAARIGLIITLLSKHSLFSAFLPFLLVAIFWKSKAESFKMDRAYTSPALLRSHVLLRRGPPT